MPTRNIVGAMRPIPRAQRRSWLLLLLVGGCIPRPPRVPNVVTSLWGLAVSNSPTRVERHEPVKRAGQLELEYSLLFENRGPQTLRVEAAQASAAIADTAVEIA